jgi:hypothetical protein
VDFNLVTGTLIKGFDYYTALRHPFAKAAYMMFLISEVHPFLDGNGRLARIMMNAELSAQWQAKIIIPTVYREDYIVALRSLSRKSEPMPYIRMLQRAHEFSRNIFGDDFKEMRSYLEECDAFKEPTAGALKINARDELKGFQETEIKNVAGKTIRLQRITIQNNNLADFHLRYRIVNSLTGVASESPIFIDAGPYNANISSNTLTEEIQVPPGCGFFLKLEATGYNKNFQGTGIIQYTVI